MKNLPKRILVKMNARELSRYRALQKESARAGVAMERAHSKYTVYGRALDKMKNPTRAQKSRDQKLIREGFKAESIAFRKADQLSAFKEKMRRKYSNIRQ